MKLTCTPRQYGVELTSRLASIHLRLATVPANMSRLDPDLHLDRKIIERNILSVRHTRWAEECASHSTIKMLVRLLKDLRNRYPGLQPLHIWSLQLLAHYAVMNTPSRNPLGIAQAYRRTLSLLASGILLNGATGIIDSCDATHRAHDSITLADQDRICATAQTLMRVLYHGGYTELLGTGGGGQGDKLCSQATVWNDIVITPLQAAYAESDDVNTVKKSATTEVMDAS